ncbi:cytochrome P450 2F2-like [Monodelphis domestica]|uniref:cytochrome P450 2F2-like n=1 Tax=Monodelphis domestica TaxID=13616 RepID=UPI0024E2488D|nr:cytochrome P450 2F2-like [Monodelphis domestica]
MMELGGGLGLALGLAVAAYLLLNWWRHRFSGLPPGPAPWPFLGNILGVDVVDLLKSLKELSLKYGPVYTFHLGSRPCVVIAGYQALKESLIDRAEEFGGRGEFPAVQMWSHGDGIVYGKGERWKQLRRFAIATLKNFGMGKRSLEERIREEAQHLCEEFQKTEGAPFDPTFFLSCAGSNIISSLVFGDRFAYDDPKFLELMALINSNWRIMSSFWGQLLFIFPKIMGFLPGPHHQIFRNYLKLEAFVNNRVAQNRSTLDPAHPRDYIDCFLIKMEQEKNNPQSHFNSQTLSKTAVNLFFAGTETVSSTLRYGLLILLKHPDVEAQLHKEIDEVIGPSRPPSMEDRVKMPYMDAVIHEIQRFTDIVPMSVPHTVTRATTFRGYHLPKDLNIIPLLCTAHFDHTQFKDPEKFDPAHFLDKEGKFKKNEAFLAFSAGKRLCLGEGLALTELFIFLTSLLQRFSLSLDGSRDALDLSPESQGLGSLPRPYKLRLLPH